MQLMSIIFGLFPLPLDEIISNDKEIFRPSYDELRK